MAVQALNYELNTYLAVSLAPTSPFQRAPEALAAAVHPAVTAVGSVGELSDVLLLSVPKGNWGQIGTEVMKSLESKEGVQRVDVQEPLRQRAKRGGDEL